MSAEVPFQELKTENEQLLDIEIDAISKVLGVTLDYLFGRSEE